MSKLALIVFLAFVTALALDLHDPQFRFFTLPGKWSGQ